MEKAIMLEHRNEYGEWVWYRVLKNATPQKALASYYEEKGDDMPEIKEEDGTFICDDEARAYEIPIETL